MKLLLKLLVCKTSDEEKNQKSKIFENQGNMTKIF